FLFEAGFGNPESPNPGMIAVTQPRRVAAVSMAKRVGTELGEYSDRVAYQIRFDSTVSDKTAIKFMTDGVLIREIAQDFALRKYSIIIIDEAHERSVNTDILIGMVSRIIDLRQEMTKEDAKLKPLKMVIMSATLRISDFLQNTNLFRFGPPPLVQAEGRQYPVTVHFAKRTRRDYIEEAFRKVTKGHKKLPPGGFLVFLTGQGEIKQLVTRLKQTFRSTQGTKQTQAKVQITAGEAPMEAEDFDSGDVDEHTGHYDGYDEDEDELDISGLGDGAEESEDDFDPEEGVVNPNTPVHVLPLYSQLPTAEQLRVFDPVPGNARLIVVATNVAETSLTIPGIRYVFDCGRSKEKQYDTATGIQRFQVGWISKASASQRAGRAGRTGPGHCYRLYSSAVYEGSFEDYTDPEILRTPVEGVVLQMKSMGLHQIINFPFPTPPSKASLLKAQTLLKNLGAIDADEKITETGRHLSLYPVTPRFGKMLQIGHQHGCFPYVVAMVAALSVGDLFIPENQLDLGAIRDEKTDEGTVYTNADRLEDTEREQRKKAYAKARRVLSKYDDKAEALRSMAALCAYAYGSADPEKFCKQMFLRPNAMKEAAQLRRQLYDLVRTNHPAYGLPPFNPKVPEPSDKQIKALKQIVAAGFIDQVAIRADLSPSPPEMPRKPKRAIDVPYFTLFSSREDGRAGRTLVERAVFLHPSSLMARQSPSELPQYIIYSHLQQAAPSTVSDDDLQTTKVRMFPLTPVSGLQLSALAHGTPLIEYGKPIGKIEPVLSTDGSKAEKRECWVVPSLVGEKGVAGWPLPAKKVVQKKDIRHGWVIEKFL
ncbi:putative ATP-dependent RNA helicase DHR1, partial [Ascosphaera aggregata]